MKYLRKLDYLAPLLAALSGAYLIGHFFKTASLLGNDSLAHALTANALREGAWALAAALVLSAGIGAYSDKLASSLRSLVSKRRVFLSYSKRSSSAAEHIAAKLRDRGIKVWVDKQHIEAGTDWATAIEKAIADSDLLVALLSSENKGQMKMEIESALSHKVKIIPVLIEEDAVVPDAISRLAYVESADLDTVVHEITRAVS